MKKLQYWLNGCLGVILVASLVLVGYVPKATPSPKPKEGWPKAISLGTKPIGSAPYLRGIGMAKMIEKYTGVTATAEPFTGSMAVQTQMAKGRIEMGIELTSKDIHDSVRGVDFWSGKKPVQQRLITWGGGGGSPLQIITRAASGIKSIQDIRGKRIMCRVPGSKITDLYVFSLFKAMGLDPEKDFKALPSGKRSDIAEMLREGRADANIRFGRAKESWITELVRSTPLTFVSLTDEEGKRCQEVLPTAGFATFPAGYQTGMDKPVKWLSLVTGDTILKDVPDSLVYEIVKAIWGHFEEACSYHHSMRDFRLDYIGLMPVVPWHAGAINYFKEIGIWNDELEQTNQRLLKEIGQDK